jgi:glycosyltransferase involved in cell wall biosynthesis
MIGPEGKPVVLTTVPYYLPGFKGGGKLVTVRNLVAALSSQFKFKVLTANHDLGDLVPYQGIPANQWVAQGACEIFYSDSKPGSLRSICQQLRRADYDILHLNTVFSRPFGIVPLLLRRFGAALRRPTIIAPRGELGVGALAIKPRRKKSFLLASRALGLFDEVTWQASGREEAEDIRRIFGAGVRIALASDLVSTDCQNGGGSEYQKHSGQLDILFLSRITPKKNLHLVIESLRGLAGDITLHIVGPIDDRHYWERCRKSTLTLGANIRIDYSGPVTASEVAGCFARHGLFFLPTANENFGFVILEALLAGCPVLISDQTPWRDLREKGVGWDLPLSRPDMVRATLERCIAMDAQAHRLMSVRAREFALDYLAHDDSADRNAAMFHAVLDEHRAKLIAA